MATNTPNLVAQTVVRHRTWPSGNTGTVTRIEDGSAFVQWHNTCVEDEIPLDGWEQILEVTDLPNPPHNGLRLLAVDGCWRPVPPPA